MELKNRIEQLLSEILSDKYECVVRLRFEPRDGGGKEQGKHERKHT